MVPEARLCALTVTQPSGQCPRQLNVRLSHELPLACPTGIPAAGLGGKRCATRITPGPHDPCPQGVRPEEGLGVCAAPGSSGPPPGPQGPPGGHPPEPGRVLDLIIRCRDAGAAGTGFTPVLWRLEAPLGAGGTQGGARPGPRAPGNSMDGQCKGRQRSLGVRDGHPEAPGMPTQQPAPRKLQKPRRARSADFCGVMRPPARPRPRHSDTGAGGLPGALCPPSPRSGHACSRGHTWSDAAPGPLHAETEGRGARHGDGDREQTCRVRAYRAATRAVGRTWSHCRKASAGAGASPGLSEVLQVTLVGSEFCAAASCSGLGHRVTAVGTHHVQAGLQELGI